MSSLSRNLQLEVACPACPESYAVPLDVIEESQRLLGELGPCTGMASYECPVTYFAGLVTADALARLEGAFLEFERDAVRHHARPVWAEHDPFAAAKDGDGRVAPSDRAEARTAELVGGASRRIADERTLARALERWEDEGGALGRR
jgi:hypothetical protein